MMHKQQLERTSNSGKRDVVLPPTYPAIGRKFCWRLAAIGPSGRSFRTSSHGKQVWAGPSRAALGQDQVASAVRCPRWHIFSCDRELDRKRDGLDPIAVKHADAAR